jgi:hypothetical protein
MATLQMSTVLMKVAFLDEYGSLEAACSAFKNAVVWGGFFLTGFLGLARPD